MQSNLAESLGRVKAELSKHGFLLLSDSRLPSVSGLVAQEPIRGSWWGHPKGKEIYAVAEELSANPDIILVKLISEKATFVHRVLWSPVVRIASARNAWQLTGLSSDAKAILLQIEQDGFGNSDQLTSLEAERSKDTAQAVRQLENRLLVFSEQVHTASGAHAKKIESWEHWTNRTGFVVDDLSIEEAQSHLEQRLGELKLQYQSTATLPWQTKPAKPGRR